MKWLNEVFNLTFSRLKSSSQCSEILKTIYKNPQNGFSTLLQFRKYWKHSIFSFCGTLDFIITMFRKLWLTFTRQTRSLCICWSFIHDLPCMTISQKSFTSLYLCQLTQLKNKYSLTFHVLKINECWAPFPHTVLFL